MSNHVYTRASSVIIIVHYFLIHTHFSLSSYSVALSSWIDETILKKEKKWFFGLYIIECPYIFHFSVLPNLHCPFLFVWDSDVFTNHSMNNLSIPLWNKWCFGFICCPKQFCFLYIIISVEPTILWVITQLNSITCRYSSLTHVT